jgi:DNA-binding CsgD family transcriptional regulator
LLDEAGSLAELLTEPQRLLPVVFARAEAAWLAGTLPELRAELAHHVAATQCREDVWRAAELSYWLHRADAARAAGRLPAVHRDSPFATQLHEQPRVAAARWQALDRPYEAAVALLDGGVDDVREALATFVRIGAEPAGRLARRRLRELGVSVIPRGPRRSTACHPYGLTSRENEVLHLLTEDLTNHEIATRLVVSERTVDHHVSALLAKLQVRSRSAAAALARSWPQHGRTPCPA